jgi:hypothetical protein
MNNNKTIEETLEAWFGPWFKRIRIFCKHNQGFNGDAGTWGEVLGAVIKGVRCTGTTGGNAFDLSDKTEIKTIFLCQSQECNKCNNKVMYFLDKCPCCNSADLREGRADSRAGISASSHVEHNIPMYLFTIVDLIDPQKGDDFYRFSVKTYKIDSKNSYFNKLCINQHEKSKSDTVNFLPFSYDFYRSNPERIFEAEVKCEENGAECSIKLNVSSNKHEHMPIDLLKGKEVRAILDELDIDVRKSWSKAKLVKLLTETLGADIIDHVKFGGCLPLRNKAFNKARGPTRRSK